jgi:hypothetical protein
VHRPQLRGSQASRAFQRRRPFAPCPEQHFPRLKTGGAFLLGFRDKNLASKAMSEAFCTSKETAKKAGRPQARACIESWLASGAAA